MDKKKKIISLLLLTLFVSYYASTTFFFHSHQYAWGTVIHSHPYTAATHAHSVNALQLINNLTNLLFVGGGFLVFLMLLPVSRALNSSFDRLHTLSIIGCNLLRGPPALA